MEIRPNAIQCNKLRVNKTLAVFLTVHHELTIY